MSKTIQTKYCLQCKQIKHLSEFYKNRITKDGLDTECKVCRSKRVKKYHQTEKGKVVLTTAMKRYYQSEKGKAAQRKGNKKYRQSEKGKINKRRYQQSKKGKDAYNRYQNSKKGKVNSNRKMKRYSIRHPERKKARSAVESAVRTGRLPRPDTLQCHYCPKQAKEWHHHKGYEPKHWLDVVPICIPCHRKCHIKEIPQ